LTVPQTLQLILSKVTLGQGNTKTFKGINNVKAMKKPLNK